MNPRNEAAILYAQGEIDLQEYYRLDQIRLSQQNAAARSLSDPYSPTVGVGSHYDAGDQFLYDARGRCPGAPEIKE